ncbi:MAG: TetR/AcrR family transcriptional regulator [bacterium]|nr:TetR/AcrR family transcriptional regulator [bacterium]
MKKDPILEQAFALIGQLGWADFKITDLASKDLDLDIGELRQRFGSKEALLKELIAYVDAQMFEGVEDIKDDVESPKEYLFEILMTRLEILAPYKQAIRSLWGDLLCDFPAALSVLPEGLKSAHWMLEVAGIDLSGGKGGIKSALFSVAYLAMISAWLKDEGQDESKMMAFIDRMLEKMAPYL